MVEQLKFNKMAKLKITNLCYPEVETWFICWDKKEIKAYSYVNTDECLSTNWKQVDYYTNEAEWAEILIENGIDPNE